MQDKISRRDSQALLGSSIVMAGGPFNAFGSGGPEQAGPISAQERADRARGMKWWHEAKFGMFIHPVSVIEVEFGSEPRQDLEFVRREKMREGV
jgi:hypothetical protein